MSDTRARKLCKGWLDYKQLTAVGSTWERAWVVLRGNTLFIFEDDNTVDPNSHTGTLTVDRNTKFICEKDGNQQRGFKFDLTTGRRHNRFKTRKASERELWRGYILGVAKGVVPDDIDLLESEIDIIRTEIRLLQMDSQRPRNSVISNDSGMEDMISIGTFSKKSTGTGSSGSDRSVGSLTPSDSQSGGGPTLVHRFYPNSRDQRPPSWFFSNCSRDRAEQVIRQGRDFGNTLMRESTTDMRSGSYVITKGIWEKDKLSAFEHFKVTHTAGGYKIDVENKHEPMRYLSEVMEYFVRTSGGSSMPMSTNDLSQLGIDHTDYDRVIQRREMQEGDPWVWPPPACRGNVAHDYDTVSDPVTVRQDQTRNRQPSYTLRHNPGGRQENNAYYPNKTVGPQGFGGPKGRPAFNPVDIEVGAQASARLSELDKMLGGFDPPSYVNVESERSDMSNHSAPNRLSSGNRTKSHSIGHVSAAAPPPPAPTAPPAPPVPQAPPAPQAPPLVKPSASSPPKAVSVPSPAPHTRTSQHSYVNDTDESVVIASLPVAPPPPRHPIGPGSSVSSATSTPSLKSALKSTPSTPSSQAGSRSSGVSSNSVPVLRKVQSAGHFGGVKNTGSPASFPSWTKQPVNSDTKPVNNADESASGNDDDKPAGFKNIRSLFEGKSNSNSKTDSPAGSAVLRKQGVKRVTIQEPANDTTPPVPTASQLNTRRNTAPDLHTQLGTTQTESGTMQGLNPEFKKQLEGLFSGSTPEQTKKPNQNAHRPLPTPNHVDHVYEELPDRHITPDSVTYVNDVNTSQSQQL